MTNPIDVGRTVSIIVAVMYAPTLDSEYPLVQVEQAIKDDTEYTL